MSNALIFNHHALLFDSIELAEGAMPEFLRVCLTASRMGLNLIRVDDSIDKKLFNIQLAPAYFWRDWYNKHSKLPASRELVQVFRSIQTKPLFTTDDFDHDLELFDVRLPHSKESQTALTASAWHQLPLISFPTRNPWDHSPIDVIVEKLVESGELTPEQKSLTNIHSIHILNSIRQQLQAERKQIQCSGKILYQKREEFFPFLEFCGKTEMQLDSWSGSSSSLQQVQSTLLLLSEFVRNWQDGEFTDYSHEKLRESGLSQEVSGESSTVRNNPKLRRHRHFYLPNGTKEFFQNHIKLSHGIRLHFFPDSSDKKVYVAYIGKHLPLQ